MFDLNVESSYFQRLQSLYPSSSPSASSLFSSPSSRRQPSSSSSSSSAYVSSSSGELLRLWLLFFHHSDSVGLYSFPLERVDEQLRIVDGGIESMHVVKAFQWLQWDAEAQQLFVVSMRPDMAATSTSSSSSSSTKRSGSTSTATKASSTSSSSNISDLVSKKPTLQGFQFFQSNQYSKIFEVNCSCAIGIFLKKRKLKPFHVCLSKYLSVCL